MAQRLLFITPKIDEQDDDLAFTSQWARAFERAGFDVTVICGTKGACSLTMPVYTVGHVQGGNKWKPFLEFQKLILTLKYDRVFVHMNTRWLAAGAWYWWIRRIPTYLWFTHYTRPMTFRIGEIAIKRMFAATVESLPQFNGDPRKVVTGHGVDTKFWDVPVLPDTEREPATHLLAVHRISRSKRLDIVLRALALLPNEYRLTHYGRPLDPTNDLAYEKELHELVKTLGIQDRVRFMGSVPMPQLRGIYPKYRVFVNVVPRTIDKSVLEAMSCGLTPVIMRGQAEAIGYPDTPKDETPEALAEFIRNLKLKSREELRTLVEERHGLDRLIEKMAVYIRPGN